MDSVITIYFSGVAVAAVAAVLVKLITAAVSFLMREGFLEENYAQVGQYISPFTGRWTTHRPTWRTYLAAICLGLAQSWLAVVFSVYKIAKLLLMPFRRLFFTPPPLAVALEYPLRMSVLPRELAWARFCAVGSAVSGSRLDARQIGSLLDETHEALEEPTADGIEIFDVVKAVQALQDIKTAHPELLIELSAIQEALDDAKAYEFRSWQHSFFRSSLG